VLQSKLFVFDRFERQFLTVTCLREIEKMSKTNWSRIRNVQRS